jgi:hypothetical protein
MHFFHFAPKYLKNSFLKHPMKVAEFVYHMKDYKTIFVFEFKNRHRRRTAALKKTANFFSQKKHTKKLKFKVFFSWFIITKYSILIIQQNLFEILIPK